MSSRREGLGSWLEGTPGGPADDGVSRLGLPLDGPGSLAQLPRRVVAVAIDWTLSLAVSGAFFAVEPDAVLPILAGHPLATVAIFGVTTFVLVATLGHTIGHRLLGLHVLRLPDAQRAADAPDTQEPARGAVARPTPGAFSALVRTVLLCLVVPAVVWDADGRGMHDVAAGTVLVRR